MDNEYDFFQSKPKVKSKKSSFNPQTSRYSLDKLLKEKEEKEEKEEMEQSCEERAPKKRKLKKNINSNDEEDSSDLDLLPHMEKFRTQEANFEDLDQFFTETKLSVLEEKDHVFF